MGKVDRLPGSSSLGPKVAREIRLDQGGPKANERALGSLMSAMRASRPGIVPAFVREEEISEHQINLHAADQLSDYLQGVKSSPVEAVGVDDLDRKELREVVVFEAGRVDSTIVSAFPVEAESLEALGEQEEAEERVADDDRRGQGIFDYATTKGDLQG